MGASESRAALEEFRGSAQPAVVQAVDEALAQLGGE